ncbi:hypothetical protein [Bartonella sp. A05]|uniref:hypothetical protein n=1 Tax=Bartonella sp. A05 TaxID=2967261 RepID=UPI0022A92E95|nr:hypothetical protein [Bartonella sp. A05]MCZ2204070.1 hypothetical protein [Bartonella sp. A05]
MRKVNLRLVIILILSGLFIFAASLLVYQGSSTYKSLFSKSTFSNQADVTEDMLLERLTVSLPDVIMDLSKMSDTQKQAVIKQARRDAIAAASASGQSNEQAQKFGETVAMAVSKALYQPSVGDSYF